MNVQQAIHLFISERKHTVTKKTLYNNEMYLRSLGKLFGERAIETITLPDLRAWRASLFEVRERYTSHNARRKPLQGGYALYTLKGMVEAVRQLFNWLVREGYLEKNPALGLTVPKLPTPEARSATPEDLEKLLDTAHKSTTRALAKRNVAVILFLRDTGCRLCGIAGLRVHQLDVERREALVYEKGRGGKSKARLVFFKPETQRALRAWLAVRPRVRRLPTLEADDDFVFVSDRYPYPRMTEMAISCMFRDLKKRAGITGRVNPHSLRHGLAKRMLQNGASLGQVSRILGHADIRITDKIYGVFATQELKEAHEKYA